MLDAKAARLAAGDLLSRRAWTIAELTRRLVRRGAPPEVAAAVVDDLAGRGYVDDAAFARHFVETRAARGYGAARMAADLRARGVASTLVTAALADLDGATQLERARTLARRRLGTLTDAAAERAGRGRPAGRPAGSRRTAAPDRTASRLRDFLLRRGFASSIVLRVVQELTGPSAPH